MGTFEVTPFAEGKFRLAYKGMYNVPPKKGQQCVVKENKEAHTWKSTDWDVAMKVQEKAKELAQQFNAETNCTHSIIYTDIAVRQVISAGEGTTGPQLNEYVIVEDYIPGKFTKWCNNYGYTVWREISAGLNFRG